MVPQLSEPLEHSVSTGVSWDEYEQVLQEFQAQHCHARVTYDQGKMEIMTRGNRHERFKSAIARLIEMYAFELDIPIGSLGSVTLRRRDLLKGLEPDVCYYITRELPPESSETESLDLSIHPPPDLAIEVDITNISIPRQPIYAAIEVREIWRYDGRQLVFLKRSREGRYTPVKSSSLFPRLSSADMNQFLDLALTQSQHIGAKALRDWVRKQS